MQMQGYAPAITRYRANAVSSRIKRERIASEFARCNIHYGVLYLRYSLIFVIFFINPAKKTSDFRQRMNLPSP